MLDSISQIYKPNPNFSKMCTSSASLFAPTISSPSLLRRRSVSIFISSNSLLSQYRFSNHSVHLPASVVAGRRNDVSWFPPPADDEFGGWEFVDSPVIKHKKGLPTIVIAGVGTSIAILLAAVAYFSLSRKGFNFQFGSPFHALHGMLRPSGTEAKTDDSDASNGDFTVAETNPESVSDAASETRESAYPEKTERVIIPVAMDPTQQEALLILKKLKIVEDDVKADELCTRREYARWLVRANLLLERNPKCKIVPSSIVLPGSIAAAFDDISVEDPDFGSIQALAEAGVIPSKVGESNSCSEDQGGVYFYPDRFISRQDLIDWKAQLDYEFMPVIEEKSRYREQTLILWM